MTKRDSESERMFDANYHLSLTFFFSSFRSLFLPLFFFFFSSSVSRKTRFSSLSLHKKRKEKAVVGVGGGGGGAGMKGGRGKWRIETNLGSR